MRFKKFILIPIMIILYVLFIRYTFTEPIPQFEQAFKKVYGGLIEEVPIGETVTVTVTRPYLFGLIRLPIQLNGLMIAWMHSIFFHVFIPLLTVIFIIIEVNNWRKRRKINEIRLESVG